MLSNVALKRCYVIFRSSATTLGCPIRKLKIQDLLIFENHGYYFASYPDLKRHAYFSMIIMMRKLRYWPGNGFATGLCGPTPFSLLRNAKGLLELAALLDATLWRNLERSFKFGSEAETKWSQNEIRFNSKNAYVYIIKPNNDLSLASWTCIANFIIDFIALAIDQSNYL